MQITSRRGGKAGDNAHLLLIPCLYNAFKQERSLTKYSMLNDKMALLPLKISDAYLLVWGVLCLGIGILQFGQYCCGWLASIAAVTLVTGILLPHFFRSLPSWRQKGIYIIALGFLLIGICVAALQHYSHRLGDLIHSANANNGE